MYKASWVKFVQNPALLKILFDTGERELIEDSTDDQYWGVIKGKGGLNRMGEILMKIRRQLRERTESTP